MAHLVGHNGTASIQLLYQRSWNYCESGLKIENIQCRLFRTFFFEELLVEVNCFPKLTELGLCLIILTEKNIWWCAFSKVLQKVANFCWLLETSILGMSFTKGKDLCSDIQNCLVKAVAFKNRDKHIFRTKQLVTRLIPSTEHALVGSTDRVHSNISGSLSTGFAIKFRFWILVQYMN